MAINFPDSPTEGQLFTAAPGTVFKYTGGAWARTPYTTALTKNYLLNGAMQVSQQNAETAGTVGGYFMADQWVAGMSGIVMSAGKTISTDGTRVQIGVTTAKPTLAVGDHIYFYQALEGLRIVDWQFGTPQAQQLVFRCEFYCTVAGTYTVALTQALNRSWAVPVVCAASVWNQIQVVIPGDTGGTWPIDNVLSAYIRITPATGTTYMAPSSGVWANGNHLGAPGQSNGAATTATFYLKSVGLYLDPFKTGVAPAFEVPSFGPELRRCQRYWQRLYGLHGWFSSATAVTRASVPLNPHMRILPPLTMVGTPGFYDGSVTSPVTTVGANTGNNMCIEHGFTCSAGTFTAARPAINYWTGDANYFAASARM